MLRPGEGGRGGEGRGRAEQTGRGRPSDHVEENHISATRSVIPHTNTAREGFGGGNWRG